MNEVKNVKISNYVESVLRTVSSYYKYEEVKTIKNDDNSFKKYCIKDGKEFKFLNTGIDSLYQDAEIISMTYRILEDLRLENIIGEIKVSKDYNVDKLKEYLEYLDIDYEISNEESVDYDMIFEIREEIKDKKIVLAKGEKSTNSIESICYLDNIMSVLEVVYEDENFDVLTQVLIVGETEEERIAGMRLAQDLRWCEIVVDFDTNNKSREEQLKNKQCNFIIDIDKENLNKGLLRVIDNLTKEETCVDESEIIDYIVSNI